MRHLTNLQSIIIITITLMSLFQLGAYKKIGKTSQQDNQYLQTQISQLKAQVATEISSNRKLKQQLELIELKLQPEYYNLAQTK